MQTDIYFLIHGAWHQNWCWEKFAPILKAEKNCKIFTPNRSPKMHLQAYVSSLKQAVLAQNTPVILAGHSLGGVIISQLAEEIPDSIKEIIYITSYVPQNQHSMWDEVENSDIPGLLNPDIVVSGDTITLNKSENVKNVLYTQCDDTLANHCLQQLMPDSLAIFSAPITLTENNFGRIPKKYICCSADKALHPTDQRRMYQRLTNCKVINIDADHSPFLSMPHELAKLF